MEDDAVASRIGLQTPVSKQSLFQFSSSSVSRDSNGTKNPLFQIRPPLSEDSDALTTTHSGPLVNDFGRPLDRIKLNATARTNFESYAQIPNDYCYNDWQHPSSDEDELAREFVSEERRYHIKSSTQEFYRSDIDDIVEQLSDRVKNEFPLQPSASSPREADKLEEKADSLPGPLDTLLLPPSPSPKLIETSPPDGFIPLQSYLFLPGSSSSFDKTSSLSSHEPPIHYTISKDKTKDGGEANLGRLLRECGRRL